MDTLLQRVVEYLLERAENDDEEAADFALQLRELMPEHDRPYIEPPTAEEKIIDGLTELCRRVTIPGPPGPMGLSSKGSYTDDR